ncbi:MAG: gamma-glutamyltransferase [Kiritimatiellia bacterium]|nr:gamma-glutamyltransferase [Kiritimatiellia bacterium]
MNPSDPTLSGLTRRDWLQAAAAAGALTLIPGSALATRSRSWRAPGNRSRQRLVEAAHFGRKKGVSSKDGVAICTHPLASQAAIDMLKLGGNACDAIMAASLAQAVVEPHMTTLSGCLSMLYYDAASGEYSYVNGMMAVPKSHPFFEKPEDLAKMGDMTRDGQLACVPGFWAGFESGHERHGRLPRGTVMAPAIHYAREGFEIHPFLWGEMFVESANLGRADASREMYFRDGALLNVGDTLVQTQLADTLERLVTEGSDWFYRGEFGRRYAATVQDQNGYVTADDMAGYEAFWDTPARGSYRDYEIIAAPSPDYGGEAFIEIMNMAELLDIQKLGPAFESPETTLKLMQMIGRVYSDSIGGRMTGKPLDSELAMSKAFAEERFANLEGKPASPYDALGAVPPPGSNHVTVVDGEGNVATILHSVMSLPYTTGIWVDGVYVCASGVHMGSGIPEPGGRAFARILPNMFAADGKPVLASGSPSVSLTENIVQTSISMLDFGLDIETAVHKPRFGGSSMSNFGALMVEADMGEKTFEHLRGAGAIIEKVNPWNWTHGSFEGIRIEAGVASACGDPRRTAQAIAV